MTRSVCRSVSLPSVFSIVNDGREHVAAHQHPNGGGWVDERAQVDELAFVGENAKVIGAAVIRGPVGLYDWSSVDGEVVLSGCVSLRQHARVSGKARIAGRVLVTNHAQVTDDADVEGTFVFDYYAVVGAGNRLRGCFSIGG